MLLRGHVSLPIVDGRAMSTMRTFLADLEMQRVQGMFLLVVPYQTTKVHPSDQKGERFANSRKLAHGIFQQSRWTRRKKAMYMLLIFALIDAGIIFDRY